MAVPPGHRAAAVVAAVSAPQSSFRGAGRGANFTGSLYMSAIAQSALAVKPAPSHHWTRWAILATDVLALEIAFGLGLAVRWMLRPWFTASIGVLQSFEVAIAILLLPAVHYQLGLYP